MYVGVRVDYVWMRGNSHPCCSCGRKANASRRGKHRARASRTRVSTHSWTMVRLTAVRVSHECTCACSVYVCVRTPRINLCLLSAVGDEEGTTSESPRMPPQPSITAIHSPPPAATPPAARLPSSPSTARRPGAAARLPSSPSSARRPGAAARLPSSPTATRPEQCFLLIKRSCLLSIVKPRVLLAFRGKSQIAQSHSQNTYHSVRRRQERRTCFPREQAARKEHARHQQTGTWSCARRQCRTCPCGTSCSGSTRRCGPGAATLPRSHIFLVP